MLAGGQWDPVRETGSSYGNALILMLCLEEPHNRSDQIIWVELASPSLSPHYFLGQTWLIWGGERSREAWKRDRLLYLIILQSNRDQRAINPLWVSSGRDITSLLVTVAVFYGICPHPYVKFHLTDLSWLIWTYQPINSLKMRSSHLRTSTLSVFTAKNTLLSVLHTVVSSPMNHQQIGSLELVEINSSPMDKHRMA